MTQFFGYISGACSKLGDRAKKLLNFKHSKTMLGFFVVLIVGGLFLRAGVAHAQGGGISSMLGDYAVQLVTAITSILLSLTQVCIGLAIFALKMFIEVARYNNYIDTPTVQLGWLMVRDVANMFFVVTLLLIAFGTILGIESYEYKKLLGKLIISAILINFSNTICQLIIDAAHVFTITFANAIMATAGGNLIKMFGMDNMMAMLASTNTEGFDMALALFASAVMSFFFAFLAMTTIGAYMIVMIARMVILWALIILSPLAYILGVIPQTQSYASQWWDKFGKHVIVAPVMVFFLWLAFATMGTGNMMRSIGIVVDDTTLAEAAPMAVSLSKVSSWESMSNFMVAVVFLFIGIQITQQLGVVGGGLVGSAVNFTKSAVAIASGYTLGRAAVRGGLDLGKRGVKATGKFALMKAPIVGGEKWVNLGTKISGVAREKWGKYGMARNKLWTKVDEGYFEEAKGLKGYAKKGGYGALKVLGAAPIFGQTSQMVAKKAESYKKIGDAVEAMADNTLSTSKTKAGDKALTYSAMAEQSKRFKEAKGPEKFEGRMDVLMRDGSKKYGKESKKFLEWQNTIDSSSVVGEQLKKVNELAANDRRITARGVLLRSGVKSSDEAGISKEEKGRRKRGKDFIARQKRMDTLGAKIAQDTFDYQEKIEESEAIQKDKILAVRLGVDKITTNLDAVRTKYRKLKSEITDVSSFDKMVQRAEYIANTQKKYDLDLSNPNLSSEEREGIKEKQRRLSEFRADLMANATARGGIFESTVRNVFSSNVRPTSGGITGNGKSANFVQGDGDAQVKSRQAHILAAYLGREVGAGVDDINTALNELRDLKGAAFVENMVDALNMTANDASAGLGGLFRLKIEGSGDSVVKATDVGDAGDKRYLDGKQKHAISNSSGGKKGFAGSVDLLREGGEMQVRIQSDAALDNMAGMLSAITFNRYSSIDDEAKLTLVHAINNAIKANKVDEAEKIVNTIVSKMQDGKTARALLESVRDMGVDNNRIDINRLIRTLPPIT